jgi:flagellum-specific ATP synthase
VTPDALSRLDAVIGEARAARALVDISGIVAEVTPSHVRVAGLSRFVTLGDCVAFESDSYDRLAEVVRIDPRGVTVTSFDGTCASRLGDRARNAGRPLLAPHESWKGRVVDALGRPIDAGGPLRVGDRPVAIDAAPPPAMRRARVTTPVRTGVRVVDLFTPICAGQRIGIFAGSGVGKSTLLAMLAAAMDFDTVVIGLVGERGREVREFLEDTIASSLARTVAVVATGDESAAMRRLAPKTATCIAEHFRDRGDRVLLVVDSVTRFAHATREVALAAGEPAVARGYPPSVFTDLPRLLERSGPGEEGRGSITGIFAVLVDGDDHNDPVADAIRGTLDGHIVLDRSIAEQGRFPAVDLTRSISRLAPTAWTSEQQTLVLKLRSMVARYEDTRDLRLMGGYRPGSDLELDQAVTLVPAVYDAMRQSPRSEASRDAFRELANLLQGK